MPNISVRDLVHYLAPPTVKTVGLYIIGNELMNAVSTNHGTTGIAAGALLYGLAEVSERLLDHKK